MIDRSFSRAILAAVALLVAPFTSGLNAEAQAPRPNIVVILADDIALMDFGAYGGEARTPNIDRLAASGAMFTNYRTSPLCSPSRAMLLTGIDNHRNGVATIEEVLPPEQRGKPGYTLRLEPGVVTLADHLKASGYRTLMSGKWHLGSGEGDLPNHHGFDRSLALDASGADNWAPKSYMPYYRDAPWYEDGQRAQLPQSFYSSDLLVDRLINYIDEAAPGASPWFGYLSFQAVHIPIQAPRELSDGYAGRFDQGWEVLREARWRRAQEIGLIPENAPLAPMPSDARVWNTLSPQDARMSARSMEVYSGMIEAMDRAIGRLIAHIEARGELENTVFVITSDNGPEPSDPVHKRGMNIWMALNGYHWDVDRLGEPGSLAFIGLEWAAALSSPNTLYKFYASDGGLRVPMIMSGPGIPVSQPAQHVFVTDITPTLLELADVPPSHQSDDIPMTGVSFVPALHGAEPRPPGTPIAVEVSGNAALLLDGYKIVRNMPPVGDGEWRLFNLTTDPGETQDISAAEPQRLETMIARYADYEADMGVLPLPPGYQVERQVLRNAMARQLGFHWPALLAVGVVLLALGVLVISRLRRRRKT